MTRFMPLFALAFTMLAATVDARGGEVEFQEFRSDKGKFTIDLPRRPIAKEKDAEPGLKEYSFYCPVSEDLVFMVKYMDLPQKYVVGKDPQERMTTFRRGARKGKEFVDDKVIKHEATQVPGRDYRLEAEPGFFVRERMFFDNGRLYSMYIGSSRKSDLDSKHATRFFSSFQIER